jgi:site-specific DNA-methyltransferase (adenine-specific)
MTTKTNGTKTSKFGTNGRYNHDSSEFYNKKIYSGNGKNKKVKYEENEINPEHKNKIFCKSSEKMSELPDNSVHLMVTSPPYNVGKEYDEDLSLDEYYNLLKSVFKETHRVLVPGGRVAINIANVGRKPYIPLHSGIIQIMSDLGFLMRGEVIWDKGSSAGGSCAWGSWKSASNPTLRDGHEYILIFSKDDFQRKKHPSKKDTISRDEFLELTKSIWKFNTESAKKVKHPAPFPTELPRRLIQLYTFEGDVVLDPFMGSGSAAIAAVNSNRHFVGYDNCQEYVDIANKRISKETTQTKLK